jgi:hypothetical protein
VNQAGEESGVHTIGVIAAIAVLSDFTDHAAFTAHITSATLDTFTTVNYTAILSSTSNTFPARLQEAI